MAHRMSNLTRLAYRAPGLDPDPCVTGSASHRTVIWLLPGKSPQTASQSSQYRQPPGAESDHAILPGEIVGGIKSVKSHTGRGRALVIRSDVSLVGMHSIC